MVIEELPTLSTDELVGDEKTLALKLYSYFITSNYSQTRLYKGYVASLKYLFYKYQNKPEEFVRETKNVLQALYDKYITDVKVDVSIEFDGAFGVLNISISGNNWDLERIIKTKGGTIDPLEDYEYLNIEGKHDG